MGSGRAVAAAAAGAVSGAEAGVGPALPPGHPVRPLQRHSLATPAAGAGFRLGPDVLAPTGAVAGGRSLRPVASGPARRTERGWRTRTARRKRGPSGVDPAFEVIKNFNPFAVLMSERQRVYKADRVVNGVDLPLTASIFHVLIILAITASVVSDVRDE